MRTIISAEQLRSLLNDTRQAMAEQPWIQAIDDQSHTVGIPHGKVEALHRLERDQWVFVPLARTKLKTGKMVEHGFEIHRRETGWEVITAALELQDDKLAKVHAEAARNHAVQSELEKLRLRTQTQSRAQAAV
jgi:hypothetical protein